jgi:hypothetical protein
MTPLPDLVPGAPVPCFMVQELNQSSCFGCVFRQEATEDKPSCSQEGTTWRRNHDRLCGVGKAIFIPATREAFDAHQLELITARLTT